MGQDGSGSGFAVSMAAASLCLLLSGPGRWSADHLIAGAISSRPANAVLDESHV